MISSESSPHTRAAPDPMKAPFAYAQITLPKADYIELMAQDKQWRTQWQRTRTREKEALDRIKQIKAEHAHELATFQEQIATLKNQLAGMQHRFFGHSTEKKHSSRKQEKKTRPSSKSRGQQRGHKGHGRTTITHRYLKTCQCEQSPAMTLAPGPAKLIRKGKLGISVWVEILLHKYAFGIPAARQLNDLRHSRRLI